KHPHLLDPNEAFYRLIGLFAGPTIKVETNPLYNPDAKLLMHDPVPYAVRKANTVIRIETHLPGLLGSQEGASIRAECRLHSTETVHQRGNPPMTEPVLATDMRKTTRTVIPAAQIAWPGSLLLYVSTPASRRWNGKYSDTSLHHEWYLRVQARVELPEDTWVFPAPAPKVPLRNAARQAFSAQPEVFYPITAAQELWIQLLPPPQPPGRAVSRGTSRLGGDPGPPGRAGAGGLGAAPMGGRQPSGFRKTHRLSCDLVKRRRGGTEKGRKLDPMIPNARDGRTFT